MSINRFIKAQSNGEYEKALKEIQSGRKKSHWIWYIFPQMKGLGYSQMSQYYGLDKHEVCDYVNNELLFTRLKEITQELIKLDSKDIKDVLGEIDSQKVKSCMTLFYDYDDVFKEVLKKYYDNKKDQRTTKLLSAK